MHNARQLCFCIVYLLNVYRDPDIQVYIWVSIFCAYLKMQYVCWCVRFFQDLEVSSGPGGRSWTACVCMIGATSTCQPSLPVSAQSPLSEPPTPLLTPQPIKRSCSPIQSSCGALVPSGPPGALVPGVSRRVSSCWRSPSPSVTTWTSTASGLFRMGWTASRSPIITMTTNLPTVITRCRRSFCSCGSCTRTESYACNWEAVFSAGR